MDMRTSHKRRLTARPIFSASVALCASLLLTTIAAAFLPALSVDQVAQIAYNAGFRGDGLVNAIAIGWAESSFIPDNVNTTNNVPPSRDRGIWQINDHYHSEVSDTCAFDPVCAAGQAYRISKGGTDWHEWNTLGGTRYNQYLPTAQAAANRVSGGGGFDPTNPYVDASYSGTQTGTANQPFKTVAQAVNAASTTQAVTIHIKPGVYHESMTIHKNIHLVTWGSGTARIGG